MTSNLYLNISQSYFFENVADAGGVFHFLGPGFLEISGSHFEGNRALHSGGVFVFTDNSLFSIKGSSFVRNYAFEEASVGKFEDVRFRFILLVTSVLLLRLSNTGQRELQHLHDLKKSNCLQEYHLPGQCDTGGQRHPHPSHLVQDILLQLFLLKPVSRFFDLSNTKGSECGDSSITGGFIHDLISNQLNITSSVFQDVCAYEGGALFLN